MNQEEVWDNIAEQWNNFRQKKVDYADFFFHKYAKRSGKVLDIGCGNCRNLLPFAKNNFNCYGIDFSKNMLNHAKNFCKKHNINVELKKADMINLPFKNNSFDYLLFLSSLHHLNKKVKRLKALKEAYRVLKKDGILILSVWNKLQLRFLFKKKNSYVPWRLEGKKYMRYYHLFNYFELKILIKKTKFNIVESNFFGKNLVFVLKK